MKKISGLILLLIVIAIQAWAQDDKKITTFILLRHAEKADDSTDDPDLKPEGYERASKIVSMFKNTSIDAIYSTRYKRAKNTVTSLAKEKGLEIMLYEAFKPEEIEKIISKHAGGTIVISGHSNNIPWIANLLIGKEEYKTYADQDYGNLLIVSVVEKGKNSKVTWLTY